MCKAYSLDCVTLPIRRALPYASMCQGFALKFGKESCFETLITTHGIPPVFERVVVKTRGSLDPEKPSG